MKKGKLIVIDGTDGSGKATQTKELVKRLRREGLRARSIDFPRYCDNFFGRFIGECLAGLHGDFSLASPYVASTFFAADRFESSKIIRKWIEDGYIVVTDRYVSANQIHQGGKIKSPKERKKFLEWLEKMEFEIFQIPKPSAIIFLDVPIKITQDLLKNKKKEKRRYLNGNGDLHENSPSHLHAARKSAIRMVKDKNNWISINCVKSGKLKSVTEVAEDIWQEVKSVL
ncbi:MAG: dTMP kinase [Patescibacteria group bacterium]